MMFKRYYAYVQRFFHEFFSANLAGHRGTDLVSGPLRLPRFVGCTCGRIFYVDKFGDPHMSDVVQALIDDHTEAWRAREYETKA